MRKTAWSTGPRMKICHQSDPTHAYCLTYNTPRRQGHTGVINSLSMHVAGPTDPRILHTVLAVKFNSKPTIPMLKRLQRLGCQMKRFMFLLWDSVPKSRLHTSPRHLEYTAFAGCRERPYLGVAGGTNLAKFLA